MQDNLNLVALNKVQEAILKATGDLHRTSIDASDDQWFRRAQIAQQMGAPSGTMNASRIGELEKLVVSGHILKQQKPDDKRSLPVYRLP
jgi:hypothetical protein